MTTIGRLAWVVAALAPAAVTGVLWHGTYDGNDAFGATTALHPDAQQPPNPGSAPIPTRRARVGHLLNELCTPTCIAAAHSHAGGATWP